MKRFELDRLCRSITDVVAVWLSHQEEITRAVHRIIVAAIQAGGEAPPLYVIQDLHDEYPDGWPDYCEAAVALQAIEILKSEFTPLSNLFSEFYNDFNVRYFGGSLPPSRVRVVHNLPLPDRPRTAEDVCARGIADGEILLHYNGWPDNMLECLVHLMAHLKVGPAHGAEFDALMANANMLGAPVRVTA